MIKLNPDPTFEAMVRLSVAGHPETMDIPMTFRHKTVTGMSEWFTKNEHRSVADALDELIVEWSGVMDDAGQFVPYTKAALEILLKNYQPATNEIILAYMGELTASKIKN